MSSRMQMPILLVLSLVLAVGACRGDDGDDGQDGADAGDGDPAGPVISEISTVGAPIMPGEQAEVRVSAHSPAGETLSYDWEISEDWEGEDTGDDILVVTAPEAHAEQAQVSVEVSDGEQSTRGSTQLVTRGPIIESFEVSRPDSGDEASLSVDAYNLEGKALRTHYDLGGKWVEDAGTPWTWDGAGTGGKFRFTAVVEDPNGLTADASVDARVEGASPWPGFGGDRQRTSRSTLSDDQGTEGEKKWSFDTEGEGIFSSATLLADGTVLIGSNNSEPGADDGRLYWLDPEDGSEIWYLETEGAVGSAAAVADDGSIYFGSNDATIYAYGTSSVSSPEWTFETAGTVFSSPVIGADGTVYVGSNSSEPAAEDGRVYALDPEDGSEMWSFEAGRVHASPALGPDGTVYVGSFSSGRVYALDSEDGSKAWSFETAGDIFASPAVGPDGTVYAASTGSFDQYVYALDPEDGSEKWSFGLTFGFQSSPAVGSDGTVYIGAEDDHVYALDPDDGSEKWSFETGGRVVSSPSLGADGAVYVGSRDDRLYALDKEDGSELWSFNVGEWIESSPAIGEDGTIYVGANDGKVYAIQ